MHADRPQACFNAIDDNCNGIIDEGCGVCTGPLQFTIAWGDSKANVDLEVDGAAGKVNEGARTASSGLKLDLRLSNNVGGESCNGQNVENVCLENGDPPKGSIRRAREAHRIERCARSRAGALGRARGITIVRRRRGAFERRGSEAFFVRAPVVDSGS